jgi:hypothetical protein
MATLSSETAFAHSGFAPRPSFVEAIGPRFRI